MLQIVLVPGDCDKSRGRKRHNLYHLNLGPNDTIEKVIKPGNADGDSPGACVAMHPQEPASNNTKHQKPEKQSPARLGNVFRKALSGGI